MAREARYGKLTFRDRSGQEVPPRDQRRQRVGVPQLHRRGHQGGRRLALRRVNEGDFPDGLPIELALRVFRTYKGATSKRRSWGASCCAIRRPKRAPASRVLLRVPRVLHRRQAHARAVASTPRTKPLDLFKDLVQNGKVDVEISCAMPGQYFGMAQYDVYLRVVDRPFAWNFVKGYVGIWLRMVLVIGFGVMFSTFLRGAWPCWPWWPRSSAGCSSPSCWNWPRARAARAGHDADRHPPERSRPVSTPAWRPPCPRRSTRVHSA